MKKLIVFIAALMLAFPAYAEELSLSVSAKPDKLPPGEIFRLTVTVAGSEARSTPDPVVPRLKNFKIVGKSTSHQISMTNFTKVNVTKSIVYQVRAGKEGTFEIPPVILKYKGKTYQADPLTIIVDSSAKIPSGPRTARRQSGFPGGLFDDSFPPGSRHVRKDDLFVSMDVNKKEVTPYEQVIATFSFFRAVDLWETPSYGKPDFSGFWVEDMVYPNGKKEKTSTEEINGRAYHVTKIRYALAPLTVGESKIGPASLNAKVDPWSNPRRMATKPVTINVKPFPEEGRPEEFSNMVGSYKVSSSIEPSSKLAVNDGATLRVTVTGEGYLKPSPPPAKPVIEGFEVFDPKVTDKSDTTGEKMRSTRVIEYPLIPREAGEKTIPPIKFAWYDPAQKKYVNGETKPVRVSVAPSTAPPLAIAPIRSEVTRLNRGLQYLKQDTSELSDWSMPPHRNWWIWLLIILPVPVIALALGSAKKKKRLMTDSVYAKKITAAKTARVRLDEIGKVKDQKDFYAGLDMAVRGYLSDIWDIPAPSINGKVVQNMLADSTNGITDGLSSLLESMEVARYAPSSFADMVDDLNKAKELIVEIEKIR